jgi:hypothetical protein
LVLFFLERCLLILTAPDPRTHRLAADGEAERVTRRVEDHSKGLLPSPTLLADVALAAFGSTPQNVSRSADGKRCETALQSVGKR